MELTAVESKFLDMIKASTIEYSTNERICPSVIAAVGYIKASHGNDPMLGLTNNIYKLTTKNSWFKKVYSKDSKKVYDSPSDCTEIGPILYRVYDSYDECIKDYINFLLTYKRGKDGPYKYESIRYCTDYKETVNKLVRAGFMQDQFNTINNVVEIDNIIKTIEELKLYEWDNLLKSTVEEEMSKRKNGYNKVINNSSLISQQNNDEEDEVIVTEEDTLEEDELSEEETKATEHMYRVRLIWDNPDTQIFASTVYDDAVEEASKHSGYKVFIDDDGEVIYDPWEEKQEEEKSNTPGIKKVNLPVAGKAITLINTPVYDRVYSTKPYTYLTGTYYFYDYEVSSDGRVRITDRKDIARVKRKDPSMLVGYIFI